MKTLVSALALLIGMSGAAHALGGAAAAASGGDAAALAGSAAASKAKSNSSARGGHGGDGGRAGSDASSNSGGNKSEDNDDNFALGLGFPPPAHAGPNCMGSVGVIWNFVSTTTFDDDCARFVRENGALTALTQSADPLVRWTALARMCSSDEPQVVAFADIALAQAGLFNIPQVGIDGCPNVE